MRNTLDQFAPQERGRFGENEQPDPYRTAHKRANNLVDLTLELRDDRPASIAVTDPAKPGSRWIFLPKSQCEVEQKGNGIVIVTLPEWLAKSKGLI